MYKLLPASLFPSALLGQVPTLLLLAALLMATLAACGGNDEEKRATETETATAVSAAGADTPAPQLNTLAPTANETVPGEIEVAARKLLADELEVDEGDFRLDSSEGMEWSDASLGCPQEGMAYAQVLTSGYKLIFDLAGTSYAVHTNDDGTNAVVCRDDSGVSAPAADTPTPTPEAQMARGAELTTQEYVEAIEEAISDNESEFEDAAEELLGETFFTIDALERFDSLETAESWSEEDARFASEFAETFVRATTTFHDMASGMLRTTLAELSDLRSPAHLTDLHNNFIASSGEVLRFSQVLVNVVKDADTDIKNREDLAGFQSLIDSLESGFLDPEMAQQAQDLEEKLEDACLELEERIEAELERVVNICE